ncbi:helix-turn-helix transcriptional regulator [Marinibaculum pumilum]|uniref:Helix-turn-helix transcriptional regulator n=1 Tax=Marinibaculum pumilum TaxID=1766165 RepID=A0ABV7L1T4_9PROT
MPTPDPRARPFPPAAALRQAAAERIHGGLYGARWRPHLPAPPLAEEAETTGRQAGEGRRPRVAILVGAGAVALRHDPAAPVLEAAAPAVLWCDWPPAAVLAAAPGSRALAVTVAEGLLTEAVGLTHDTDHLRALLRTGAPLALALSAAQHDALAQRMAAIDAELRERGDGFHTALSAHLVLLALALWRRLNAEGLTRPGAGGSHAVLERFRRLLELHFRERWGPGAYAAALGLPVRRLNRICSRHLGRGPGRLINQRSLREAQLRLERSAMTIAQIADELGFVDPPHFSRFFKAQTGQSPRAWRARARHRGGDEAALSATAFSDWP